MLKISIFIILASMSVLLIRAIKGPSIFDRILTANTFGTNIVVLIALMGYLLHTTFFLDIALTYALINFITTIALLRYFKYKESRG